MKITRIWPLLTRSIASMLAIFMVTAWFPAASSGQVRTWALTTSGDWDVAANWIGTDVPNSLAESAVLGGVSAYTVNFDLGITIGDLSITNANAQLLIQPDVINTALTVSNGFSNMGTISISSDSTRNAFFSVSSGALTNAGTINFGGTSTSASTIRRLTADVINNGTVNVDQNAQLTRANGVFTNNNTVNIAATKLLDFSNSVGIFNQDAGTVNNLGQFNFFGDTLNFNGGNFTGNAISLDSSNLNIGVGSVGTGTFNMTRVGTYSGDLAAAQTLNILDGATNTLVTAGSDFTNNGVINLNSDTTRDVQLTRNGTITNVGTINFGGTSTSASTVRRLTTEVVNNGTIDIIAEGINTEIGRTGAAHSNSGLVISREAGSIVEFLGNSFTNQSDGVLSGLGELDFTQTGLLNNGTIAPGLSPGTLNLDGDILFGASSNLLIELGGTTQGVQYDLLNALDLLDLDGAINVSFIDGFQNSVLISDTFTVVTAGTLSGTFAGIADGDTIVTQDGFGTFTLSYSGNSVVLGNFQASAVPEPTSVFLLGIVVAFCGATRRRRIC